MFNKNFYNSWVFVILSGVVASSPFFLGLLSMINGWLSVTLHYGFVIGFCILAIWKRKYLIVALLLFLLPGFVVPFFVGT